MKYIIVNSLGTKLAIIFDEILEHKEVAGNYQVISAGFCDKDGNVWGQSLSLSMKSKPKDSELIRESIERRI